MSLTSRLKRLKTPEVVENNGGWWAFIVFIGAPAVIAIAGLVDPIFDAFLSLFSVDSAGQIKTSWELKYILFFVFFLFIPSSIYLLYIRLNPGYLQRKARDAYELVTSEVSRIYAQMYGPDSPRHNLEKLHLVFHIDRKYGMRCESRIDLFAKQDLHLWKSLSEQSRREMDRILFLTSPLSPRSSDANWRHSSANSRYWVSANSRYWVDVDVMRNQPYA
jgi:hypothetical protein